MDTVPSKTPVLSNISNEMTQAEFLSARAGALQPQLRTGSDLFSAGDSGFAPIRRLVILVPNIEVNEADLARQVWELASPAGLAVLFLSLCPDISEESRIHRRLITLATLTHEPRVPVETHIEFGKNWIRGVKNIFESGDVIVCQAEQHLGFGRKPLYKALESLRVPVWTFGGFYPSMPATRGWLVELVFWFVSIAILLGFYLLQIQILQLSNDWAQNIYLFLTVISEVVLLWGWHLVSS